MFEREILARNDGMVRRPSMSGWLSGWMGGLCAWRWRLCCRSPRSDSILYVTTR